MPSTKRVIKNKRKKTLKDRINEHLSEKDAWLNEDLVNRKETI